MKMLNLTAIVFLTLLATNAWALIGETPQQCAARYGEPAAVRDGGKSLGYQKGRLLILAHFFEGKCDHITFGILADENGNRKEQTGQETAMFRTMNGGDKKWLPGKSTFDHYLWFTEDLDLQADYDVELRSLSVFTTDYAERENAKK